MQQIDKIIEGEKLVFMAQENKFNFLEPGAPLWPSVFSFNGDLFEEIEKRKHVDFGLLAKETSIFIGNAYLICNGKIQGCFYERDYNSAVKQLQSIFLEMD